MMTPWHATEGEMRSQTRQMPRDLVQARSLTLDWTLLASYQVAFEMLEHRNALADAAEKLERAAQQMGDASMRLAGLSFRRITPPTVIAPQELMPLNWIIDYEDANHLALFARDRADAARAMAQR
jgi:NTE family protein